MAEIGERQDEPFLYDAFISYRHVDETANGRSGSLLRSRPIGSRNRFRTKVIRRGCVESFATRTRFQPHPILMIRSDWR